MLHSAHVLVMISFQSPEKVSVLALTLILFTSLQLQWTTPLEFGKMERHWKKC